MTWPTASIATTNLDAGADSPASARGDLLTAVQQINSIRDYFDDAESDHGFGSGTMNIGAAATNRIRSGGTTGTNITSFGSTYSGPVFIRFTAGCVIVYNATSLITPSGANMTVAAGDCAIAWPKATGTTADGWVVFPMPGSGRMVLLNATPDANCTLVLGRNNATTEGGQLGLASANTNAVAYNVDVYRDDAGSPDVMRFVDNTAGAERMRIDNNGNIVIGTSANDGAAKLDLASGNMRMRVARTPASAAASGNIGEICWDASFLYVCTATNTWKRVAIATW